MFGINGFTVMSFDLELFSHCTQTKVIDMVFPVVEEHAGLRRAITRICDEACAAAKSGYTLIVLSDRKAGKQAVPVR